MLVVRCLDKHDEDTDAMNGQTISVHAMDENGNPTRLRLFNGSGPWSEYALIKCEPQPQPDCWGFCEALEFEGVATDIRLTWFGYDYAGAILHLRR